MSKQNSTSTWNKMKVSAMSALVGTGAVSLVDSEALAKHQTDLPKQTVQSVDQEDKKQTLEKLADPHGLPPGFVIHEENGALILSGPKSNHLIDRQGVFEPRLSPYEFEEPDVSDYWSAASRETNEAKEIFYEESAEYRDREYQGLVRFLENTVSPETDQEKEELNTLARLVAYPCKSGMTLSQELVCLAGIPEAKRGFAKFLSAVGNANPQEAEVMRLFIESQNWNTAQFQATAWQNIYFIRSYKDAQMFGEPTPKMEEAMRDFRAVSDAIMRRPVKSIPSETSDQNSVSQRKQSEQAR